LTAVIDDEEAVSEMLSQFPSRDVDEPLTRNDLDLGISDLRAEMADLRAEMAEFRGEMRAEMAAFKGEMRAEFAAFREEMRVEMHREFRRMMVWNVSTMVALFGAMVAVVALVR
jgi:hypothetical protein